MTPTCSGCGCLRPGEPVYCRQCRHELCEGCVGADELCDTCHDIESERES